MRFSINTVLFISPFTNASIGLFRQFSRWGFDVVELLIEDPAHIASAFVKRKLDQHGLACGSVAAAINPGRDLRGNAASRSPRVATRACTPIRPGVTIRAAVQTRPARCH